MFYEKRIGSFAAIIKEASTMDADAGIRVLGRYGGRRCYAFVTRFGPRYTVMIYERKAESRGGPGRRFATEEVEGIKGLGMSLKKVAAGKVEAFAY